MRKATLLLHPTPDLLLDLTSDLRHPSPVSASSPLLEKARRVLEIEIEQLKRLSDRLDDQFSQAITALKDTLLLEKKIVIIGVGKSENIGKKIVATFNSTGATAVNLSCQNALHGDLGLLSTDDLIIALSYSGETQEMMTLLPHVKKRATQVIALTGNPNSTLARHSDIVLDIGVDDEACPLGLAPTSSSTNMLVLGDALAMVLLEERGFQEDDFAELHPSGTLGKYLLTRVSDIMRKGSDFVKVDPETTVQNTVLAMLACRAGAATIVNPDDSLVGIFTHGDFVRGYQNHRDIGDTCVCEHMTKNPITVQTDDLAVNVVKIIRENRIDDVIVLEGKKVAGLIDVQDLSRFDFV